jgi:hypothetical protein
MQIHSLSAAEHLALLDPNREQGREALKLVLMELVVRGVFAFGVASDGKREVLMTGREVVVTNPVLQQVETSVRALLQQHVPPLTAQDLRKLPLVLQRLQQNPAFGPKFVNFWRKTVRTSLLRQQLLRAVDQKVLLVFHKTRYEYTTAGLLLKQQLEQQMISAHQTQDGGDLGEMAALALTLGSAVLLVPELWPHMGALQEEMRRLPRENGDGGGFFAGIDDSDLQEQQMETQSMALDGTSGILNTDFGAIFSDFATGASSGAEVGFDAGFDSSFDAGFAGSDGGGSDGGGGDGGGGGGE